MTGTQDSQVLTEKRKKPHLGEQRREEINKNDPE